jgi:hypothetical protein
VTPERALLIRLLNVQALPACWKRAIEAVVWPVMTETPQERAAIIEEAERMASK